MFSRFYFLPYLDEAFKAISCHGYGIHAYVNKQFHAVSRGNAYGVFGIGDKGNISVKRRYDDAFRRGDSDSAAQNTGGKGCIRDFLRREDCAGNGGINDAGLAFYGKWLWLGGSSFFRGRFRIFKAKNQVNANATPTETIIMMM